MVKTFKQHQFNEKYQGEPGVGTTEYEDSIEDSNFGPHNIHEKDVLQKVNAWVGSIAHKEHYLKPKLNFVPFFLKKNTLNNRPISFGPINLFNL